VRSLFLQVSIFFAEKLVVVSSNHGILHQHRPVEPDFVFYVIQ
jgi:hypothetical protein